METAQEIKSILIDALKKRTEEYSLETKADEEIDWIEEVEKESGNKKEKKDPIIALAERIKQMYVFELVQDFYSKTAINNYKASDGYNQSGFAAVQQIEKPDYEQVDSFEKKRSDIHKRIKEENSKGYKLNKDSRYQANVMSDPRGRLVSTWTYVRSVNETADGKIELNNEYITQGF